MIESFREAFGRALVELGREEGRLVVLDADVKDSTKTVYFARAYPERFFQVGISEQDMVSMAAGFAIAGKIPVASAFAAFLMRAWEQIRNTVARDNLNVKLVSTHSGFSDHMDGSSHQCLEDVAITRVLPNMTVVVPADAPSVYPLLKQVVELEGPVYMRLGRDYAPRVYEKPELELGKASVLREGDDVLLIANGVMVSVALDVAKTLEEKEISAGVVDLHTVKPLDEETLLKLGSRVETIVTLEEHSVYGGLGGAVAELFSEKMPKRVIRIGTTEFGRSSRDYVSLLDRYGLTAEKVSRRLEGVLA